MSRLEYRKALQSKYERRQPAWRLNFRAPIRDFFGGQAPARRLKCSENYLTRLPQREPRRRPRTSLEGRLDKLGAGEPGKTCVRRR